VPHAQIALVRCDDYEPPHVAGAVRRQLELLGGLGTFIERGDTVLLKPNFIAPRSHRHSAAQTHPAVILEVAKLVQDYGARPLVADSPAWANVAICARMLELTEPLRRLGVPLRQLNAPRKCRLGPNGPSVGLSSLALDADVIINLPKFKTHQQMVATFAVKNMFGCVSGKSKALWHFRKGNTADEMAGLLERLGLAAERGERLTVTVPTRRPDLEREIDLVEEVAILHGYNNLPMTLPGATTGAAVLTRDQKLERRVREIMRAAGLCERVSFSMMGERDLDSLGLAADAPERSALRLRDPVNADEDLMRTTMLPALLEAARENVRQRVQDVALFDLGRVFLPAARAQGEPSAGEQPETEAPVGLPEERRRLGALVMGQVVTSAWNLPAEVAQVDFYWLKGLVEQLCRSLGIGEVAFERAEHPTLHAGRSARLLVSGEQVGAFGEIAPEVRAAYDLRHAAYALELDLETLFRHAQLHARYQPVPRLPAVLRDLALVVPDDEQHTADALTAAVRQASGEELESVQVFDVYVDAGRLGAGNKQIALRLSFRHPDRTLTDDEVDGLMQAIAEELGRELGARVRDW